MIIRKILLFAALIVLKTNKLTAQSKFLVVMQRSQLIDIVYRNLINIDQIRTEKILSIATGVIKKRNKYSTRIGVPITIKYSKNNEVNTMMLWAKAVELPQESYEALKRTYDAAAMQGVSDPIPKPYFYDANSKLVFMDMKVGINLIKHTLQYTFTANLFPNDKSQKLFYRIGEWLHTFHATSWTGETAYLMAVVDDVVSELRNSIFFNSNEKRALFAVLNDIRSKKIARQHFPLVRPHNDFTLRNLFITPNGGFYVIDWDAMVHPQFPEHALGWWDLTTLIINLQSFDKIAPIIRRNRIKILCDAAIEGYCSANIVTQNISSKDFYKDIYFLYTLKYWLGLESDRPLSVIYRRNMGHRYTQKLRKLFLNGRADIFNAT